MLYIIRKSSIRSNKDLKLSKFSVKRRGGVAWSITWHGILSDIHVIFKNKSIYYTVFGFYMYMYMYIFGGNCISNN